MFHRAAFIIPTMNRKQDLDRFLDSVSRQTVLPSQIIIVDGSQISDDAVVKRHPALPVEYIHAPQKGLTVQRNIGIARVRAEIDLVAMFDDDIVMCPGAMEKMMAYWATAPADVGGAGFNITNDKPPSRFVAIKKLFMTGTRERGAVLRSGFNTSVAPAAETKIVGWMFGGATVWRKIVFEKYRYDEWFGGYGFAEDFEFSLSVGKAYRLAVVADAPVLHLQATVSRIRRFAFGRQEIVYRHYVVVKHRYRFNIYWFYWACVGVVLENVVRGIIGLRWDYFVTAAGNIAGIVAVL
ncbi:MAG: glycosyltransferase [Elusimicrobia bacterium]|nr:glycosyltransferase [Elusimicrobiota bacterium]